MITHKYIAGVINGLDTAVVFHQAIPHLHMARVFTQVTSAGFVGRDAYNEIYLTGESVSMNLRSDPADLPLVKRSLP